MLVNQQLVSRHVEDAAFLWSRRRTALRTSQLTHEERVRLDMRLQAHLEGAWIGGDAARGAALERLAWRPDPEVVFAAAALTLSDATLGLFEGVLAAADREDSSLSALVSAVGWHAFAEVEPILARWAAGTDERLLRLAIAGFASHRRSPDEALVRCLRSVHPALRAAAAKAAGDLGELQHSAMLGELLADDDGNVRFQAARTLARFGAEGAPVRDVLLAVSESSGPLAEEAVAALVRLAPRDGVSLFRRWARDESSRRLALVVAGTLGSGELVEALLPWMNEDGIARSAGEAFRAITGADLLLCGLARRRPSHVPGDPTDDPDDPRVELPADYLLPFPSAAKVAAWWRRRGEAFASGIRYLDGKAIGAMETPLVSEHLDNLRTLARTGRPAHRTMAARALALARPTLPTIETHSFATGVHVVPGWEAYALERADAGIEQRITA